HLLPQLSGTIPTPEGRERAGGINGRIVFLVALASDSIEMLEGEAQWIHQNMTLLAGRIGGEHLECSPCGPVRVTRLRLGIRCREFRVHFGERRRHFFAEDAFTEQRTTPRR